MERNLLVKDDDIISEVIVPLKPEKSVNVGFDTDTEIILTKKEFLNEVRALNGDISIGWKCKGLE